MCDSEVTGTGLPDLEDLGNLEDPAIIDTILINKYEQTIKDLLSQEIEIDTNKDFDKFKIAIQRKYKFAIKNRLLLQIYRKMVTDKKIIKNEHYEQFMRTKKQRGEEGVIVVTLVTSPWPKTAEEDYGPDVEGSIHKGDPFEKPELTQELGKKYKTFSCKYDCFFCPSEPGQPRSYGKQEPAVARANQVRFDPVLQVWIRGKTY